MTETLVCDSSQRPLSSIRSAATRHRLADGSRRADKRRPHDESLRTRIALRLCGALLASWTYGCSGGANQSNAGSSPTQTESIPPAAAANSSVAGAQGSATPTSAPTASAGNRAAAAGRSGNAGTPMNTAGFVGSSAPVAGAMSAAGRAGSADSSSSPAGSSAAGAMAGIGGSDSASPVSCPMPALKAGDTTKMIAVGTTMRSYVLHVPATYDGSKPSPLIVDFHPLGGNGSQERQSSPYVAPADAEGVVTAFPSGQSGPSGGAWNVGPCCVANVDDVAFARALVADVSKTACIDSKRVYAVGFSMGGGMSHYLACHAADVFAAVAPAAFDLLQENVGDCTPPRPITVVSFRGSSDPIVPFAGGASSVVSGMPITFLGAQKTFETWAQLNHCTGSASAADANNCQAYSGCSGDVDVVLCVKEGGGHEPGNATVAWPILKRHTLP